MRVFEHFPEAAHCPLCGLSKDGPCVLVIKDGTQEGRIAQAAPVHVECILESDMFMSDGLEYPQMLYIWVDHG